MTGRDPGGRRRGRVEAALFGISVAAEMAGMHAQTLRTYDRLGLVTPARTSGGGRRYSDHDVELLREVQRLSQDEGVNLAGIKRIIELTGQVAALEARVEELTAETARLRTRTATAGRELVPFEPGNAVVVWRPRTGR
ncbi:heat shock protein transcriptional repressor HspR [Tomitella gaofuii]|uniref:heat shock protein transcriptional repressor HspR n=1 Tax=Tomitella gaofuii TaxID=2760083 RepID=UPI0015F7BC95|nr:helix-turn-helix transcriptional regulator [Tomitella gaofuii]